MAQPPTRAAMGAEGVWAAVAGGGSSVAGAVPSAVMAAGRCRAGAAGGVWVATAAVVLLVALRNDERRGKM